METTNAAPKGLPSSPVQLAAHGLAQALSCIDMRRVLALVAGAVADLNVEAAAGRDPTTAARASALHAFYRSACVASDRAAEGLL